MLRRHLTALAAAAVLLTAAACGDDSDDGVAAPDDGGAAAQPEVNDDAPDGGDAGADESDDDEAGGSAAAAAGATGRLELDGEDHNFRLGDSSTAQCQTGEGSVTVQDLRASDGSTMAVILQEAGAVIWEATLRGPDGNRAWFTGNTGDAEGLDASYTIADNVVMVSGEWARADDPSVTAEGQLVVTC
ncbi:MAG: hypothetical protein ACO1PW_08455 [Actinomycetota bacterium]